MVSDDEQAHKPEGPPVATERPASAGHDDHDDLPETIRQRLERLVPELVKKTFTAGMGAVFSTEEGIRKIARESLPEVAGYIASSADGAKDRVFEVIARETREFLGSLNVSEEIAKILTTLSFEIKTEIRFIPNSDRFVGAEPDVKASVRLKRASGGAAPGAPRDLPTSGSAAPGVPRDLRGDERRDDQDRRDDDSRDGRSRLRFWQRDREGDGPPDDEDRGQDE
jgi:hypothetical protein